MLVNNFSTDNIIKEGRKLKLFLAMFLVAFFSFFGYSMAINTYAASYTITFNPQGGTFGGTTSNSTKKVSTGSTTNSSVGAASRTGYTFQGWYTATYGGTQVWNSSGAAVYGNGYWCSGSGGPTTPYSISSGTYGTKAFGYGYYSSYNYAAVQTYNEYTGSGNHDDYYRYVLYQWDGSSWVSVYSSGTAASTGTTPPSSNQYYAAWNNAWGHRTASDHGASYLQGGSSSGWCGTASMTVYARWTKAITGTSMTSSISPTSYIYDGSSHCPTATVQDGSTTLSGSQYTTSCSSNTNVGTATATLTGGANSGSYTSSTYNSTTKSFYTGTTSKTFYINNATITFNANGGTLSGTSPLYTSKGSSKLFNGIRATGQSNWADAPTASKSGSTFAGWYTAASGGSLVLSGGDIQGSVSGYTDGTNWTTTQDRTLYAHFTVSAPATPTISGGTTKVYGSSATTLTCSTSTTYGSGISKYYSFGYATSDGGTPSNWTTASTTATLSVAANAYVGQRWYSCRVYASDGSSTSSTSTSATTADTEMTINNATLTFNATSNGGTGGGTVYTKTGATGVYTGIRNTTAGSIPSASKTGWTMSGWYSGASSGSKVLNADGSFTGTAVSGYTTASAWAATSNQTLYARYTINTPGTTTISGGTTKIYGASATTLTCSNSTSYASGTSKYYSFGYATSDGGTPGNWTTASTTNTLSISATSYVGQRWYSCRVYASDGTSTSSTSTSATTADTEMTINNATLTFNATSNGGTGGGTVYTKTGATGVYTTIRGYNGRLYSNSNCSNWLYNEWLVEWSKYWF